MHCSRRKNWAASTSALILSATCLPANALGQPPIDHRPVLDRPIFAAAQDLDTVREYNRNDPLNSANNDTTTGRAPYTLTLYWENDGGYFQPNHARDRYYTNGIAATLTHQPDWADRIAPYMPFAGWFGEPERTGVGYIVGQRMFTPWDIGDPELIEDDRPYAGHNFVGIYWQRARENVLDHFQLNIGLVGPSTHADSIQTWVHDVVNARDPNGWQHQLNDEPTVQTYLRRKWRVQPEDLNNRRWPWDIEIDLIPAVGLALGTEHRHVEGSIMFRAGWNLPDNFGLGRIDDPIAATDQPADRWTTYGFARTSMRIVEHNMFLEGNNWRNSHGVNAEPLVADFQFGAAVAYRRSNWSLRFSYSQVFLSHEFEEQPGADGYGALVLSATAWF